MGTSLKTMRLASIAIIMLFIFSAIMMIVTGATIDDTATDVGNDLGTAQALASGDDVTPALVNASHNDAEDWYSISLDGSADDALTIEMNVDDWYQHGNLTLYTPADQTHHFEVAKWAIEYNGDFAFQVNATSTAAADYFLVVSGGDFDYNITTVTIGTNVNPGANASDSFATATDLPNDDTYHANYGNLIAGQNYMDFWKFTTTAADAAAIDLDEVVPATYYLFDTTYTDVTSTYLTGVGTGSIEVDIPAGNAGTYYIVVNCPMSLAHPYEAVQPYGVRANIAPPPANVLPTMSAASIAPMVIKDNVESVLTATVDALDSDGTVTAVNATCDLWSGEAVLTKGAGNTWSNNSIVVAAGALLGMYDVTFKAYDDAGEYNATVMTNVTVEAGNAAPTSTYGFDADAYMAYYDEDSMYQVLNLSALITDDGLAALTYKIMVDGSAGDGYASDNLTAAIESDFWLNMTFTENGFGVEHMTVNVSDSAGFVEFNVTVTINATNDMPVWDKIDFTLPDTLTDITTIEENMTIEVDEKEMYNMTFIATDIDMDELTYKTNITGMDNFVFESTMYGGNLSFTPSQDEIPAGMDYGLFYALVEVYDASSTTVAAGWINLTFNISNVNDAPDAPTIDVASEAKNLTVNLTINAPTDMDGDTLFTYEVDFGDGEDATKIDATEDAVIYVLYTYAAAANYTINVTVKDADGASAYVLSDEIVITEPEPEGPSIEWFTMGFKSGDKDGEALDTIDITIDTAKVTVSSEIGVPAEGKVTITMTYEISGTCGDDVTVIHLYQMIGPTMDTFYAFTDPNDVMTKTEVTPESGAWSVSYTFSMEADYVEPDPDAEPGEPPVYTYAAVAWTPDGFNVAEKQAEYITGAGPDDDDDDDDDDNTMIFVGVGIGAVFLVIIIVVIVVIVIVMGKKKKAAAEEMPPAPEGGAVGPEAAGPQFCACGAEIPAGAPACPVCGAPAPAPAPAAEQQYDEFGNPIQPAPADPAAAPPAEQQYDEYGNPIQPAPADPGMAPADPGMAPPVDPAGPPADPGMAPADPAAAPPADPAMAPADPAAAPPAPGYEQQPPAQQPPMQ